MMQCCSQSFFSIPVHVTGLQRKEYEEKAKSRYMDKDSFIVLVKLEDVDIYVNLTGNVQKRFDRSNYDVKRQLPIEKKKKEIRMMKDELGRKIMRQLVALRPKMYSYFRDDVCINNKAKSTK